jgi:hypothetical protein
MKLFLATKLSVEQCKQRLHNAIDPVPSDNDWAKKANNTTFSPDPLPSAGQKMTGFGYSPGTRPVVGTIEANTFHLEKVMVQSNYRSSSDERIGIGPVCTGQLQSASYGTLIELEMKRPSSSIILLLMVSFFAILFVLVALGTLYTYVTGASARAFAARGDASGGFGSCIFVMLSAFPLFLSLLVQQSGQAEREYLLEFVKLVCHATPLAAQKVSAGEGYTGKTQHLG